MLMLMFHNLPFHIADSARQRRPLLSVSLAFHGQNYQLPTVRTGSCRCGAGDRKPGHVQLIVLVGNGGRCLLRANRL
jgi:hypothetical protein